MIRKMYSKAYQKKYDIREKLMEQYLRMPPGTKGEKALLNRIEKMDKAFKKEDARITKITKKQLE